MSRTVLEAAPNDPSGWNNLGNVSMAMGKFDEAANYYQRAIQLAPAFSFAIANRSLALYAGGKTNEAMREMRCVPPATQSCTQENSTCMRPCSALPRSIASFQRSAERDGA